jgi:hypothetical protein
MPEPPKIENWVDKILTKGTGTGNIPNAQVSSPTSPPPSNIVRPTKTGCALIPFGPDRVRCNSRAAAARAMAAKAPPAAAAAAARKSRKSRKSRKARKARKINTRKN